MKVPDHILSYRDYLKWREDMSITPNICACKKEIDWSKPIVGIRTGVDVEHVGVGQGGEHIIRFKLPGCSAFNLAVCDKYGIRAYDNQPMVKNKEPVYKGENVSIEIWRHPAGRFHSRVTSSKNTPFPDGHKLVGHKEIYVTYEV